MKKLIFIILHKLGITKNWSYEQLERWGVEDIHNGKIYWD